MAVKFCQTFFQTSKMHTPADDKPFYYLNMTNIISEQIPLIQLFYYRILLLRYVEKRCIFTSVPC